MEIAIIVFLIILNGVFSMSEIALISAKKSTLQNEAKKGSRLASKVLNLAGDPDRFLSTVQIGITLIGILTGIYSGDTIAYDFADFIERLGVSGQYSFMIAQPIIVIVVTYLTILFGELVPKRIGLTAAVKVSKIVVTPMIFLSKIASPFVWCLSKSTKAVFTMLGINSSENITTEEDIKTAIEEGKQSGEVQEVEQDIVERVFSIGDMTIDNIMTHKSDIAWIDSHMSNGEIKDYIYDNLHQTYPVAEGSLDNIIGIVHLKELFGKLDNPDFSIYTVVKKPKYFHENMAVYRMLDEFRSSNTNFGVVCDEYGSLQGIVTATNLLNTLLGNIPGNYGTDSDIIVSREKGGWYVDGQCGIFQFLEYFDMIDLYEQKEYNTLSGLLLEKLQHIPSVGESIEWNGFSIEIADMDGPRIDKLLVTDNRHKSTPDMDKAE